MPDPIVVGSSTCGDECDLCCVLAASTDSGCTKLFWQCNCPGGTLTMERNGGAIAGWSSSGPGFWFPPAIFSPSGSFDSSYTYRLKCTLASGEVYYSNEVTPSVASALCKCWDGSAVNDLHLEVNYTLKPFTRSGPTAPQVFGTSVSKTVTLGCTSGQTSAVMETDRIMTLDVVFIPEATRYRVTFRHYFTNVGSGSGSTQNCFKNYADIDVSYKCYPNCSEVAPSWFTRIGQEYVWYLCYQLLGSGESAYCASGAEVWVDSIGLVPS